MFGRPKEYPIVRKWKNGQKIPGGKKGFETQEGKNNGFPPPGVNPGKPELIKNWNNLPCES